MSLSRRRFLTISAAAISVPAASAAAQSTMWRGVALGAPASIRLLGISEQEAAPIFAAVEAELNRLENIYSVYREHSALSRLNRDGNLQAPPPELLTVLAQCDQLHHRSKGAFDPTVQPLFKVMADAVERGRAPSAEQVHEAIESVGWSNVQYASDRVALTKPGMALTLNGIAQGEITDRIAALLRAAGLRRVIVDMGEIHASGHDWRVGIDVAGQIVQRITLRDRAIATSSPFGTRFGASGHIFDPALGTTSQAVDTVSVTAPTAALADGLSTALSVMQPSEHKTLLAAFPDAEIVFRA